MFLLVVLTDWKRNKFKISMKFHFKKRNIYFDILFSPSFDVLHSSPMVYMNHTELIFQDILLYCTKEVQENQNQFFFSLLSRGWNTLPGSCTQALMHSFWLSEIKVRWSCKVWQKILKLETKYFFFNLVINVQNVC